MTSPADLVQQLHHLAGQLAAVDPSVLTADDVHAVTVDAQAVQTRLAVAAASLAHDWADRGRWKADGTRRAALALGRDAHRDHRVVQQELHRAEWLARAPRTRQAVLDGRISLDHVDLLVHYVTSSRFVVFSDVEDSLLETLAGLALFDDARRAMQYWAHLADDLLGLRRERPGASTLFFSRSQLTGEGHFDGTFDAIDTEILDRELKVRVRELLLEDRKLGVQRTPAQRRAAALVRMAARSVNADGPTARPLFQVTIGDETAVRLCELASGTVLSPDDLAPHLDAAVMREFLFGADRTLIEVSKQRTFRGALRQAILVRDRRCGHTSVCPEPSVDGDVDHIVPAAQGGATSQFNGRALCWSHNRDPDLRDHPPPRAEREVTHLDALRVKARWYCERMERDAAARVDTG